MAPCNPFDHSVDAALVFAMIVGGAFMEGGPHRAPVLAVDGAGVFQDHVLDCHPVADLFDAAGHGIALHGQSVP